MFRLRKTAQELAILRRLRLLASGDFKTATYDVGRFATTDFWDSTAAFRGANILLGAQRDHLLQVEYWDPLLLVPARQRVLGMALTLSVVDEPCALPDGVIMTPAASAHSRATSTVMLYQVHARDAANTLSCIGLGTKLLVGLMVSGLVYAAAKHKTTTDSGREEELLLAQLECDKGRSLPHRHC